MDNQNDRLTQAGNQIFRWRRLFYLIPAVLLVLSARHLHYPFGSYVMDEVLELFGFGLVLTGIVVRFWASGSSRRTIVKKKKNRVFRFQTRGIYSVMRNPFFAGEFLIFLGLSFPLMSPAWIFVSLILFVSLHIPVLIARERMLERAFPEIYPQYCRRTPLLIPSFKSYKKRRSPFRWLLGLQKEGNLLGGLGLLYVIMEQFREIAILGHWNVNPVWMVLLVPFLLLCILLRAFDPHMQEMPDIPGIWHD